MASWSKDFERLFERMFEEALPVSWRTARPSRDSPIRDCGAHYEIALVAQGARPEDLNVEAQDAEVVVRYREEQTLARFRFPGPIDPEAVRARWSDGVLLITALKRQSRRVPVEKIR